MTISDLLNPIPYLYLKSLLMKNILSLLILFFLGACCTPGPEDAAAVLMDADRDFSVWSVEHGSNSAFKTFCADEAVMLRDNSYPICGKTAIDSLFSRRPDSLFTLSWEPSAAFLARSGELGYTYGIWTYTVKGDSGTQAQGTYVTVWTKTANGWKWSLDSGNDGLTPSSAN